MDKIKYLTWNDLANLYDKRTGRTARIKPMDMIYDWAVKQKDIIETDDGLLVLKEEG